MPTRAVLFDLDETLVRDGDATAAALRSTAALALSEREEGGASAAHVERLAMAAWNRAQAGWQDSPHRSYFETFGVSAGECLWGRFEGEDPRLPSVAEWARGFQRATWAHALADTGSRAAPEVTADRLAERFREERRARHGWLFPETLAVLDRLRPDYALGLITNGAPDIQRDKIAGAGLTDYFPVTLISIEVGMGKPDPAIFARALALMGLEPNEAVMVGDSPRRDILGANRAGVRAIWIRRDGQRAPAGVRPYATIASLDELLALV